MPVGPRGGVAGLGCLPFAVLGASTTGAAGSGVGGGVEAPSQPTRRARARGAMDIRRVRGRRMGKSEFLDGGETRIGVGSGRERGVRIGEYSV
jgi:hypothetical protein